MRKNKLKHLSRILPLVISISGGLSSTASALELSAVDIAARISDALQQGYLPIAQEAISQLQACNIRALRVDGVEYPVLELQTTIDRLASGDDAPLLPRPTGTAIFLVDPGDTAVEGVKCTEVAPAAVTPATFPVGSQGTTPAG
jgi:hypothetical protein